MATFVPKTPPHLFDGVVFGPVMSRRYGVSLGINVLPATRKVCNFECPYCELGWAGQDSKEPMPSVDRILGDLRERLLFYGNQGLTVDAVTFAGNGEPTLHPKFEEIIDGAVALRNGLAPQAVIAVLTNATKLREESVRRALLKIDEAQMKLDAGTEEIFKLVDDPRGGVTLRSIVDDIKSFPAKVVIQAMFVRGKAAGKPVDNTTPEEVAAWLALLDEIQPSKVSMYSLDRAPSDPGLEQVPRDVLDSIADKVRQHGFAAEVY